MSAFLIIIGSIIAILISIATIILIFKYDRPTGQNGSVGKNGSIGYTGSTGSSFNNDSNNDLDSIIGPNGSDGVNLNPLGPTGSIGEIGFMGSNGETGYKGAIGSPPFLLNSNFNSSAATFYFNSTNYVISSNLENGKNYLPLDNIVNSFTISNQNILIDNEKGIYLLPGLYFFNWSIGYTFEDSNINSPVQFSLNYLGDKKCFGNNLVDNNNYKINYGSCILDVPDGPAIYANIDLYSNNNVLLTPFNGVFSLVTFSFTHSFSIFQLK